MKTLNLHCDHIRFKALKKALKNIDELTSGQQMEGESTDCLAVLVAIERGDTTESASKLVENIIDITDQVKTKKVVLYPYAHLSKNLGKPELAIKILDEVAKKLKGFDVVKAPFGYYKSFEIKVKGHPLSELSREIIVEGDEEAEEGLSEEEIQKLLRQISKAKLDTSKLKDSDHRIIGKKLDLWSFNNVAPGMVFWHEKGLFIKNQLINYWRDLHRRENYKEISTPQIMDSKIWKVSGHWDKYKENNFLTDYEKRTFIAKPMNCPGGILVYKTKPKSYKDLPQRIGELGIVHRVELSGVLSGLFRVIQFTQDDAHIYCTEEQVEDEIAKVMDLTEEIINTFGLKIDHIELSTRPEKRIGTDKEWDLAEKTLEKILKKKKVKYKINKGDGAFYGAKIDYHLKDSLGRSWQCSTIQFDMSLPRRFDITYVDEKGKEKRPIMLHRAIYGSLERFIGIITENYNGNFPLWLSPNQVMVMNMNEEHIEFAREIYQKLLAAGIRAEMNNKNESLGKKAREAQVQRFNYLVTIGEAEKKEKMISVRSRDSKDLKQMKVEDFIEKLKSKIKSREQL
jgi:threonyl-tRNA synthetase